MSEVALLAATGETLPRLDALPGSAFSTPAWNPFPTAPRACPFCAERGVAVLRRPDGLPVAQCPKCHCFYLTLLLSEEQLEQYYAGYWSREKPRSLTDELARYLLASAPGRAAADHTLRKIGALIGGWRGTRVLDVGCGFGEKTSMIHALGAEVRGIDIAAEAVVFVSQRLGLAASRTTLEREHGAAGDCDVVTMFEFVEHPPDPMGAIREAVRRLRPGGFLAFVTPNGTAGERHLAASEAWTGFRADMEHLQYLHVDTVDFIARHFACRVLHLEQYGFREPEDAQPAAAPASGTPLVTLRRLAKALPGMRTAIYALRAAQGRRRAAALLPREGGNYHLFAVLQVR